MNVFEKTIERLKGLDWVFATYYPDGTEVNKRTRKSVAYDDVVEIVNQVAEEYKHGHFGCNMNGQHERCKDCGLRGECSHYNTEWFGGKDINVHSNEFCEWIRDNDEFDVYDTMCRNRHVFFEGSPEDNEYKYCPYCGKEIKVVE